MGLMRLGSTATLPHQKSSRRTLSAKDSAQSPQVGTLRSLLWLERQGRGKPAGIPRGKEGLQMPQDHPRSASTQHVGTGPAICMTSFLQVLPACDCTSISSGELLGPDPALSTLCTGSSAHQALPAGLGLHRGLGCAPCPFNPRCEFKVSPAINLGAARRPPPLPLRSCE